MHWAIAMGIAGLALLIYGLVRFGGKALHTSMLSRGGLTLLSAIVLLSAAGVLGVISANVERDRGKLNESLVKMFGRAPDRLDLEGDSLSTFQGIAYYDGKRYRIQTRPMTYNSQRSSYEVTATPLDESPGSRTQ